MKLFDVTVRDRIAVNHTQVPYVCGNTDYKIRFEFDAEWEAYTTKTARFVWGNQYHDEVFTGNECPVPKITDVCVFEVGVFAGDLQTTTPAGIPAKKSILCGNGSPADPSPNVYDQVMETLNENTKVANGTAAELKEAFGNSSLYIVTAAPKKEGIPVLYADKTQAEIREAVAAGKTCLLVYHADTTLVSAGTVCLYFGEGKYDTSEAESPSFFAGVKYDTRYSLWYQYVAYVRADGHVGVTGKPIKTPASQNLKFTGAVEAEYDGSKQVTVEIPSGGAGLPETADPFKQLVTDADGKVAWEDRLAYKTTADAEVVNLEETAPTYDETDACFYLLSPWAADLMAGDVATVKYNGTDYECKAVDGKAIQPDAPTKMVAMGNLAAMGLEGVEGSNPNAPFALVAIPNSDLTEGLYGMLVPLDGATAVTLSVTSKQTQTTVKTIAPELLGLKKIDIIVAEDDTVSCDFPFDEAWAMDEGLLSASIRIQVTNHSYTSHTNTASYYAPTVYKYESKNTDGSATTRYIRIACRSTPDLDLTDTNEFTRHIQWAKVVVQGGASQTALSYMTEQGAPMTRAGSARHYRISYSRMMAEMGLPGFYTINATYDGSTATVETGTFEGAYAAALAGGFVRVKLVRANGHITYMPLISCDAMNMYFGAAMVGNEYLAYYTPNGDLKVTTIAAE